MALEAMQALYADLDQNELRNVAGCCSLSIEDVRQEARLLCWSIVSDQCDFDPARGTPRQYVMGRLWRMTLRYQVSVRLGCSGCDGKRDSEGAEDMEARWVREMLLTSPHTQEPVDPLNALLAREAVMEQACLGSSKKQQVFARLNMRDRTFAELLLTVPIDQVASLYGLTVRAVRYRQEEILRQLGKTEYQDGHDM
ncbi:MAG: hypothetical protein WBX11_15630 [Thiobacillaceae bacterium]